MQSGQCEVGTVRVEIGNRMVELSLMYSNLGDNSSQKGFAAQSLRRQEERNADSEEIGASQLWFVDSILYHKDVVISTRSESGKHRVQS